MMSNMKGKGTVDGPENGSDDPAKWYEPLYRPGRYPVPENSYTGTSSAYDFTGDGSPLLREPGPQTVEQIIARGYVAMPAGDPETAFMTDKLVTGTMDLGDVIMQIRGRYEIFTQNMYDLLCAECSALNVFHKHVFNYGGLAGHDQQYYALNKKLQDIYQEKRQERVRLWQDLSRLRQAVPEKVQHYLSALRRVSLLEGGERP